MPKKKFDPDEPMALVMERLEPFYATERERELAKTNPLVEEEARRSAYAILKNGGAKNQAELDKLIAKGWKPAERTRSAQKKPPKKRKELTTNE